ncbi:MAG: hypothetical protein EHM35_00385 [Planctomycetaceae bacterium]|nr:MAG: hypothetical protein EHM35_00385 [Planctomycetaceae bacterium]
MPLVAVSEDTHAALRRMKFLTGSDMKDAIDEAVHEKYPSFFLPLAEERAAEMEAKANGNGGRN